MKYFSICLDCSVRTQKTRAMQHRRSSRALISAFLPLVVSSIVHAQESPRPLRIVQDLKLGSSDDPQTGFSRIGPVVMDAALSIYAVEQQTQEIRVFDSRGRLMRKIGGKGKGPGEFSFIDRIGLRGDTLWASDMQLARITLFSRGGSVLQTIPVPHPTLVAPSSMRLASRPTTIRSDGMIYWENPASMVFYKGDASPPDSMTAPVIRSDRAGKVVDTIMQIPLYLIENKDKGTDNRPAQTDLEIDPGRPYDTPLRLFVDSDVITIDRKRPTSNRASTFTVTRSTKTGRKLYERRISYKPIPYRKATADSLTAAMGIRVPAFQAPVATARVGTDGSIWLRRDADGQPNTRWMVLAPNGTVRGEVELPSAMRVVWVSATHMLAIQWDEDDIPWVVRYRVSN